MIREGGLLELFLPDGGAVGVSIYGSECPVELVAPSVPPAPAKGSRTDPGSALSRSRSDERTSQPMEPANVTDLVVIVPSEAELREAGWLDRALQAATSELAPDGIVYVLVPPTYRGRVRRQLRRAGLVLETDMLHLPRWSATHYIVPLRRSTAGRIVGSLGTLSANHAQRFARIVRIPGVASLLGSIHASVAVVARHRAARPLFDWFFRGAEVASDDGTVGVRAKWRAGKGAIVLQAFDGEARPCAVAKLALPVDAWSEERVRREAESLARLGPAARAAGAIIPEARVIRAGQWDPLESTCRHASLSIL